MRSRRLLPAAVAVFAAALGLALPPPPASAQFFNERDDKYVLLGLKRAKQAFDVARADHQRKQELFDQGILSKEELDQAARALSEAEVNYQQSLLAVVFSEQYVAVRGAVKQRDAAGRARVRLTLENTAAGGAELHQLTGVEDELFRALAPDRVRDVYGSRESTHLAAECARGGFHVLGFGRVLEIVDEAGRPAAPGVPGRVLVTDLTNKAMALVRYENGDVASWSTDRAPCACGLPFPRLERVHGRTSDFLSTPSGRRIHGEWFTHLFYGRAGVARFQVHQTALDRVEVRTVGPATEADLRPVLDAMRGALGTGVVVAWRAVDEIPPTKAGKHRFTLSDVPFLPSRP